MGAGIGSKRLLEKVQRGWVVTNLTKEANKAGHNGPRRPPEGQSGESWDYFEMNN